MAFIHARLKCVSRGTTLLVPNLFAPWPGRVSFWLSKPSGEHFSQHMPMSAYMHIHTYTLFPTIVSVTTKRDMVIMGCVRQEKPCADQGESALAWVHTLFSSFAGSVAQWLRICVPVVGEHGGALILEKPAGS